MTKSIQPTAAEGAAAAGYFKDSPALVFLALLTIFAIFVASFPKEVCVNKNRPVSRMQPTVRRLLLGAGFVASFSLGSFLTIHPPQPLTVDLVDKASQIFGLQFTEAERDSMLTELTETREGYSLFTPIM
jgi:hypothetical protein